MITITDKLFITVCLNGKSLLNISISGFSSLKDVMQYLHYKLTAYVGKLLILQLRNSTQGWCQTKSMLFAA